MKQIAGSPTGCRGVVATPERHLLVLTPGGNLRKIQWASQETLTNWTPQVDNTAGDLILQTKGEIVTAQKTRYGVLIFTTSDVWRLNYLGAPLVYGAERLTEGAGIVGAKAVAGSADFVAWVSRGRFWSYEGGYIKELQCDVADYIFSDINLDIEGLIAAGHNPEFGEITWYYPKEGDDVPKHYVTYSYREKHWTTGDLERVAWESSETLGYPSAAGSDGYIYRHEMDLDPTAVATLRASNVVAPTDIPSLSTIQTRAIAKGVDATTFPSVSSEAHLCYAETGVIEMGKGDRRMSVNQIITDTDAGVNGLRLSVTTAETPDGVGVTKGAYNLEPDGYTDTRFSGRQVLLKIEAPFDQDFRFGDLRFEVKPSGRR